MTAGLPPMVEEVAPPAPAAPGDRPVPVHGLAATDVSSAIYGTLLVTALVAAQGRSAASAEFIGLTLLVGIGVFWLTHVWAGLVSLRVRGPITRAEARAVAIAESPMLAAAVPPAAALATARLGIVTVEQAINLALVVAIVQLFLWGLAVGRAVGRGWPVALLVAVVDCGLGLAIAYLKVIAFH